MSTFLLTLYVLVWPVIVAGTLVYIAGGFIREFRETKARGERII